MAKRFKTGGRQKGTPNKHKPFREMLDALLEEAMNTKNGHKPVVSLREVGIALFTSAAGGNTQAIAILADRLDGKVPQQLPGTDQEGEAGPFVVYVGSTVEAESPPEAVAREKPKGH